MSAWCPSNMSKAQDCLKFAQNPEKMYPVYAFRREGNHALDDKNKSGHADPYVLRGSSAKGRHKG
ncbi:hypothetical protein GCM10009077_33810 [Roseibium denhamense]